MTIGYLVTLSRCKLNFPHSKIMSNIIEPNKAVLDTGLKRSTTMVLQSLIYRIETSFLWSWDSCQVTLVMDLVQWPTPNGQQFFSSPRALLVQEVQVLPLAKVTAIFLMIGQHFRLWFPRKNWDSHFQALEATTFRTRLGKSRGPQVLSYGREVWGHQDCACEL